MTIIFSPVSNLSDLIKILTVAHHAGIAVLHRAEERRPLGEVIEIEAEVVVLRQRIEVGRIELKQVQRRHASD